MKKIVVSLAATFLAAQTYAASSSSSSVVAPQAPATSVSVPTAAVASPAPKLKVSYLAETVITAPEADHSKWGQGYEAQQHIALGYDLSATKRVQLRQYFYYNMTDKSRENEFELGDHVIDYQDTAAAKVGNADMLFNARLYAPGSENNRTVGKYELRLVQVVDQALSSKFTMEYAMGTRLYAYSSNADGQRTVRLLPGVALQYKPSSIVTAYVSPFGDLGWYNTGTGLVLWDAPTKGATKNPNNFSNNIATDIGAQFSIGKNVGLNLYVETYKNLYTNADYNPFKSENNTYNLELSASM